MSASASPSIVGGAGASAFSGVGFCWSLLAPSMSDGGVVDSWMTVTNEHFIMKANLQIGADVTEAKNRTVTLTEESWIELKMHTPAPPPGLSPPNADVLVQPDREKKHKSLLEIHSIDVDPSSLATFHINFFSGSASSKAKFGLSKMKRLLQVSNSFNDFLKTKTVRCHSPEECTQWVMVLDRLCRNIWQRKIETTLLHAPEYYKRHAFVIKQHNDRLLLLSEMWFYNVEVSYKPVQVKGVKWAIPISSFVSVRQVDTTSDPIMIISFDADEAKKQFDSHHRSNKQTELKNKHHEFIFRTKEERAKFVNSLAAVFWQNTRKRLTTLDK